MNLPEEISAGLQITVDGKTYTVPPPSARAGMRVRLVMGELDRANTAQQLYDAAHEEWEARMAADPDLDEPEPTLDYEVDPDRLIRKMGIDPDTYSMERDLLGEELYETFLDILDWGQFNIVSQALYIWVMQDLETAEKFLEDPTARPNRAQRRASKASSRGTSR